MAKPLSEKVSEAGEKIRTKTYAPNIIDVKALAKLPQKELVLGLVDVINKLGRRNADLEARVAGLERAKRHK